MNFDAERCNADPEFRRVANAVLDLDLPKALSLVGSDDRALVVPGAEADMNRLAAMITRLGSRIDDISVTFDCHQTIGIERPRRPKLHHPRQRCVCPPDRGGEARSLERQLPE